MNLIFLFLIIFFPFNLSALDISKDCPFLLTQISAEHTDTNIIRNYFREYRRTPSIDEGIQKIPQNKNHNPYIDSYLDLTSITDRASPSRSLKQGTATIDSFKQANEYVIEAIQKGREPEVADIINLAKILEPNNAIRTDKEIYNGGIEDFRYLQVKEVNTALNDMFDILKQSHNAHPIEKAAMLYQYFVSIHPIHDANGRLGRLLLDWILLKNGYPNCTFDIFEASAGIFPLRPGNSKKTEQVLQYVIKGINNTIKANSTAP
ncbi:MAG: Fic family protein [Proteobacteria bacterium]|nr:Fic family protein [Pseudomonadota bacterium]